MTRNQWWLKAVVLLSPLLLAGCAVLPGSSQDASSGNASPSVATQIAAAVQATVNARGGADQTGSPTAQDSLTPTPAKPSATPSTIAATHTATPPATATPSPSAVPTPVILAPVRLAEREASGGKLAPRYWTNASAIVFSVGAPNGISPGLRPQIEIERLTSPYNGIPSGEGQALLPGQTTDVTVAVGQLAEGPYHWRARLVTGQWRGPWSDYYDGPAFRLDRTPPSTVVISSTTYPSQTQTYGTVIGHFTWSAATDNGAVQGYQTSVDRAANGVPSGALSAARSADFGPLANGTLYVHVRAEDWAGNYGPVATYAVHVDNTIPKVEHAHFDRFQLNPQYDKLTMHFTPSKDVTVQVEIRRQKTSGTVRLLDLGQAKGGLPFTVIWDGRNYRGVLVQPGTYTMLVKLTDSFGNKGTGFFSDLGVNYRRIIVHLATQSMQAYDGSVLLKSTLVTTGNNLLPTPVGIWHIGAKFHPYKFISPWKKGSPYYYTPSNVQYALYFHEGGYFIHDAPWRTVYGPGTNTAAGPPGIYSGTHGCVNVQSDVAAWLYKWAPIGTVVVVQQ